jgi:hypothetical protein
MLAQNPIKTAIFGIALLLYPIGIDKENRAQFFSARLKKHINVNYCYYFLTFVSVPSAFITNSAPCIMKNEIRVMSLLKYA